MTSFSFQKRWGAEIVSGGSRFQLWAPDKDRVWLESGGLKFEMEAEGEGWFTLTTDAVAVGAGYKFAFDNGKSVPDPASREQCADVHGESRLIDPCSFDWRYASWKGRCWEEAVLYELHVGTFSERGDFDGVRERLDYIVQTGVTAIELMPVAQFAGNRGWGYDGVLPFAPHRAYGGPDALKRLIDAAHERELMVLLDVVYNHFGPEGNYLHEYASEFFDESCHTPWGAAISFARPEVRAFFVENALYWLEEFRLDGLRLDAIDQIIDPSEEDILKEIAREVRGRITDRHVHLTTEDNRNIVEYHRRAPDGCAFRYTAEWNDDWHHCAHVLATGEAEGYYEDYAEPAARLARSLAEGFAYQGEHSVHLDKVRGVPSAGQPPLAFVDFLQNHDQIGNRALGERVTSLAPAPAVEALLSILLLSPHVPLLFMGEEWAETRPFLFFTDFHGELAEAVREGRRSEFKRWTAFSDAEKAKRIPDPNDAETFLSSKLNWKAATENAKRRRLLQHLLRLRAENIAPRLSAARSGSFLMLDTNAFKVAWPLGDKRLLLFANLSEVACAAIIRSDGVPLFSYPADAKGEDVFGPWTVHWFLEG